MNVVAPGPADELDRAVHALRELARDREPEPAPRRLRALDAVEAVEDPLDVLGRDPGAVVAHGELGPAVGARRTDADLRARQAYG